MTTQKNKARTHLLHVVVEAGLELVVENALALRGEVETVKDISVTAHLCLHPPLVGACCGERSLQDILADLEKRDNRAEQDNTRFVTEGTGESLSCHAARQ